MINETTPTQDFDLCTIILLNRTVSGSEMRGTSLSFSQTSLTITRYVASS